MNPEIERLEDLLDNVLQATQQAIASGNELSDDLLNLIADQVSYLTQQIETLYNEQQPSPPPEQPPSGPNEPLAPTNQPPSADAQLLWILAGQQEDAFLQYLTNYPTPATQELLRNPAELERVIQFLHNMMPSGPQPEVDGIQHAHLNSSNIWGTAYNPSNGKMKVRFQGGAEYEYDGVPTNIYRAFTNGAASAKTQGSNNYGAWWVGKNPSLGAAMNQYIKQGGFNYRRLN